MIEHLLKDRTSRPQMSTSSMSEKALEEWATSTWFTSDSILDDVNVIDVVLVDVVVMAVENVVEEKEEPEWERDLLIDEFRRKIWLRGAALEAMIPQQRTYPMSVQRSVINTLCDSEKVRIHPKWISQIASAYESYSEKGVWPIDS